MEFTNFWSWWIVALVVTAGIAAYSYFRNKKPISIRLKIVLITLRFLALGLLLFCLILKPVMVKQEENHLRTNLLVLIDTSQSMAIADVPDNGSTTERLTAVQKLFSQIYSKLAERFDLQLYHFDAQCEGIDSVQKKKGTLSQADGVFTNVGDALSKAINDWKGQPIAGVVLLTDGRNNTGGNPLDIAPSLNAPIYPIGVGNPVAPKDVKLVKIEAPPVAYIDHTTPVNITLHSNGYDGEKIQVRLMQGQKLVDSTFITLSEKSQQPKAEGVGEQTIAFEIKPEEEGNFSYIVSVPGLEGELTSDNNQGTFFIKAIKAKLKVLFIDSQPRWEYAFLKRALERDPNIDATFMLISQKNAAQLSGTLLAQTGRYYPQEQAIQDLKKFPTTETELNSYDVLIFGDIQESSFSSQQLNIIKNFVEKRGKSVIFLGGKNSLSSSGELQNLLPVIVPPNGSFIRDEDFNPVLTAEGLYHPITRLVDTREANEAVWRDLPPLSGLYSGLQLRAGATVLAEYRNNRATEPVIVFQRYGNGKSLLIAADSLWNWAFGVWAFKEEANYYSQFWSQAIRWIATKADAKLVNVETNKPKFIPREQVQITARVYNETYQPISDAKLSLEILPPTGKPFQIPSNADTQVEGLYSALFLASDKGTYKITATASLSGTQLGTDSVEFAVQTPLIEFENPQLNEELLKQLADISGGVYTPLLQIDTLPSKIKDVGGTITIVHEDELWDSPIILLIAVGILSAEWILRKRKGLV